MIKITLNSHNILILTTLIICYFHRLKNYRNNIRQKGGKIHKVEFVFKTKELLSSVAVKCSANLSPETIRSLILLILIKLYKYN